MIKEMGKEIKVLVVEDSDSLGYLIKNYLDKQDNMRVTGCAKNAAEALEFIKIEVPDVIILDLVMPGTDGFYLLEYFGKSGLATPSVIVLSALGEEGIVRRALGLGAKYYMVKPVEVEILYKRILDLLDMRGQFYSPKITETVRSRSLDEKITSIFLAIGIPAHIKGYHFLREAIKMVVKSPDTINYITKELYPGIAEHFQTSSSKVERAIRHAIEVAWTRGKVENMNDIFGYNIYSKLEKPTNGEFIALVADKLIMEQGA